MGVLAWAVRMIVMVMHMTMVINVVPCSFGIQPSADVYALGLGIVERCVE
jgi:hypothetical protein